MSEPMHFSRKTLRRRVASHRGITLIELLVVLGILALVTTIVAINVLPELDRAAVRKAQFDINAIESALDSYRLDLLRYPTTEEGLAALSRPPAGAANADRYRPGGYLKRGAGADPWGRPYVYRQPGEHGPYDLYSLGADGVEGGEGNDADIVNWSADE